MRAALRSLFLVAICACSGAGSQQPAAPAAAPAGAARYAVPADVGALVVDGAAFARFARQIRPDLEAGADRERRFVLAMLNALDDRWDEAAAEIERLRATAPDPRARLMLGLSIRVWADARATAGDRPEAFEAALERALAALPIAEVAESLAELRAMGRAFTPDVCRALVTEAVKPVDGAVGLGDVHAIVFQRYAVVRLVPVGAILDRTLAARGIALPE